MRRIVWLCIAFLVATMIQETAAKKQSVGLVLSGGGAKGIAHIGVIQALEENDIPIDYITGTSMGAIVGGLYAAGYSPDEMLKLILSKEFGYWSTGQIDPDLEFYFTKESETPAMASVPITTAADKARIDTTAVPASLISPLPMSFAFMKLFAGYSAQCGGDFNKLFVPFRCCASDGAAHKRVVISKGDYGDAIRSSMSFPVVFQPTYFDDMLLYDGGIYDNFPADVMKADFHPDFVLGIDVSTVETGPQTSLMDQIENLIIQKNDYYLDPTNGIKIRFDLNEFSLLDFPQANAIYKIGYDQTIEMIDSIKSRVKARVPQAQVIDRRKDFKSKTPHICFDKIDIIGATPQQTKFIKDAFVKGLDTDTFGIEHATKAYYRVICTGKLNDLQPHAIYSKSTGLFTLRLKASVKNDLKAGIGGYLTSSSTSYVYLSAGFSNLRYNALAANVSAWIGQSYLAAQFNGRSYLPTPFVSAIEIEGVASRRNYYHDDNLFFDNRNPSFVRHNECFGRLKWGIAAGQLGKVDIGVGIGHIGYSFYEPITQYESIPYRNNTEFNPAQAIIKYDSNTLSDINYPVSGRSYTFTLMGVSGKYRHKSDNGDNIPYSRKLRWIQFESITRNYFEMDRHFSLGIESDVMLSTRKLLNDYTSTIVMAPGYHPTPASNNTFNPTFHANSFAAAGVVPIYRYSDRLSARLSLNMFVPIRRIDEQKGGQVKYSGSFLGSPKLFSQLTVSYSLPFATLSGYCTYTDTPGNRWNLGISFGVYLLAPQFLR